MWKINNLIQPHNDDWPILEVDCFTKPHALIIEAFVPQLYDTYLYYVALLKSYGFSHNLREGENWSFEIYSYAAKKLGFKYHFHNCNTVEEFRQLVSSKLDNKIPLLIPGNLKALYYTWAYKKTDSLHLFLVKGYEEDLNLYSIQDNMHIVSQTVPSIVDESGAFNNFIIQGNTLEDVWCALSNMPTSYYSGKVITLEKEPCKKFAIPSPEQKLRWFVEYLNVERSPLRYRELSIMQYAIDYFEKTGEPVDGRERNFRFDIIFANKKALLAMVFNILRDFYSHYDLSEVSALIGEILDGWSHLKQVFYLQLMRRNIKQIYSLEYIWNTITVNEAKLMNNINNMLDKKTDNMIL